MSVLKVQQRDAQTKPKALRRSGIVPMALVARGGVTTEVQAPLLDVRRALAQAHGAGMVDVELDGQAKVSAVVKSVDRDIITRALIHVTLQQVNQDDKIKVDLPVVAVGTPQAVTDGEAILVHPTSHLKVRGKVSDIPDSVEIDISGLGVHESITAAQAQLPAGVELLSSPDAQLFSVTIAKEPELEVAAEESVEVPTVGETEGEGEAASE